MYCSADLSFLAGCVYQQTDNIRWIWYNHSWDHNSLSHRSFGKVAELSPNTINNIFHVFYKMIISYSCNWHRKVQTLMWWYHEDHKNISYWWTWTLQEPAPYIEPNFDITIPADGLTLNNARTSAGALPTTIMTYFHRTFPQGFRTSTKWRHLKLSIISHKICWHSKG